MSKEIDSGMNLYDFNRVNMGQFPILEDTDGAKKIIKDFVKKQLSQYYMLLNHENRYFTLFNFIGYQTTSSKVSSMANDVIECMENQGFGILDVNLDPTESAIEVWVKHRETEAVHMYLLFPYDFGVIEY
jgi:hypothetical protein